MQFRNDPTTKADDQALVLSAFSQSVIWPVVIFLGILGGYALAWWSPHSDVRMLGAQTANGAIMAAFALLQPGNRSPVIHLTESSPPQSPAEGWNPKTFARTNRLPGEAPGRPAPNYQNGPSAAPQYSPPERRG